MNKMNTRSMVEGDIDTVMAIAASLPYAPQWARAAYEIALDPETLPQRTAFVVELEGKVIGYTIASLVASQADLETIAVSPHFQRSKAGSTLFDCLVRELEAQGISEIVLEVRESNATARAFYLSHSFVAEAKRKCYYADTGEDAVLMRALLPLKQNKMTWRK